MSYNLKRKVRICRDLLSLCDILIIDVSFRKNSLIELLDKNRFSNLGFINSNMIKTREKVISPLNENENSLISDFLFSLGKSDANSQLVLIEGFKENIEIIKRKYENSYAEKARLYLAFGFFSGLAASLVIL